jgi:hypothetical protein
MNVSPDLARRTRALKIAYSPARRLSRIRFTNVHNSKMKSPKTEEMKKLWFWKTHTQIGHAAHSITGFRHRIFQCKVDSSHVAEMRF